MGMVVAGFYGADVMDRSISNLLEEGKMPDVFVEFSTQEALDDVDTVLFDLAGIQAYDLRLKLPGYYAHEGEIFQAIFIGIQHPENQEINILDLEKGNFFSSNNEAVAITGMESQGLTKDAIASFGIGGTEFTLEITGIVRSAEYIFTSAYVEYSLPFSGSLAIIYMDLDDLEEIVGEGINEALILMNENADVDSVVASLDTFPIQSITYQDEHPSVTFMNIGIGKLKSMFPLMGIIFMFIGFISIFMTILRLVQNDSRYIGVLMSLGYKRRTIITTYLFLGLIISVIGCFFGVLFGVGLTKMFVDVGMSLYMSVEDIILPFVPLPFILIVLVTTTVVMFSVWVPVRFITSSSVREALEYKPKVTVHTAKKRSSKLSKLTLLGIRNATRNPKRLAVTVFVVGLTISVAGSWLVMADSAFNYMENQIQADTWDLRADFLNPVPVTMVTASFLGMQQSEVSYLIPYSSILGTVSSTTDEIGATIIACDEMDTVRDFDIQKGNLDFSQGVLTSKIADELDVILGDTLTVALGSEEITLEVRGIVYDILAHTMYTKSGTIDALFSSEQCSGAFIQLQNSEEARDIAQSMRQSSYVTKVVVHEDIFTTIGDLLDMAYEFLYSFFFFNILITIVVAGSAVIISTMERDVEFATLDTLGISKRNVGKSIIVEMLILAVLASAIGLPFAYLFAKILAVVLEEVIFYFPVVIALGASITTFVIGIAFVLISSVVPIRYAKKLDTEATIRERTAG
jgi:putative ABC transport system permease protein